MAITRRAFLRAVSVVASVLTFGYKSMSPTSRTKVVFADDGTPVGDGSGSSWSNACTLDKAMSISGRGGTIYVRAQTSA